MIQLSIIIPTAGRPIAIKSAIQSILTTKPECYSAEVIVVDNNMSEELSADLAAYCHSLAGKVRYVREPSPGLTAARHRGAAEAKGDLLTFIDDDVEVSPTWLPAIQRGFRDPGVALVGGPSIPKFTCSIPVWFWDFLGPTQYGGWMCAWLSLLDIGRDVVDIEPRYIWGLNFSIRKSVMESCNGFNPDLVPEEFQRWQGDGETGLAVKVQALGYKALYLQDALLLHLCGPERLNVDYFKKRAYYQGVCDSYSQIRNGMAPHAGYSVAMGASLYGSVRRLVGMGVRRLRGQQTCWDAEGSAVKKVTDKASRDGWLFHQQVVASDPDLLAWVRREQYFNTDIRKLIKA